MWKLHASPIAAAIALSLAALASGAQAIREPQTPAATCPGATLVGGNGCPATVALGLRTAD